MAGHPNTKPPPSLGSVEASRERRHRRGEAASCPLAKVETEMAVGTWDIKEGPAMRVRHALAVPLVLVLAALLLLAPACSVGSSSRKGRAILDRTAEFYRELDSVRVTMEKSFDFGEGQKAKGGTCTIAMARPRSLSVIPPAGDNTKRLVQNDEQLLAEVPFRRQYVLADSLSLEELLREPDGALPDPGLSFLLSLGLDAAAPESPLGANRVAYLGSVRLDGIKCRHLALNIEGGWHEIWVAKGREPWLIQYWDPGIWHRSGGGPPGAASPEILGISEFRFRDWEAGPDLTGAFTIRPREDFEQVETLLWPPSSAP